MVAADELEYRVYQREALRAGDHIQGPAAIEEPGTTTIIDGADTLSIENHGSLIIQVHAAGAMGGIGGSEHRSPRS
jgi:N-methylhydantoinase A/oxoprolinase/acetone carboxylase beta subunit